MIDFTNCNRILKIFNDGESKKEWIFYNGKNYLLKYPSLYKKNENITYYNQSFCEYISCHIFNLLGIKSQNTLIGINHGEEKEDIVVACEDITENNHYKLLKLKELNENISIGNRIIDIYNIIDSQNKINKYLFIDYFWNIFVVDAFVNNLDRDIKNIGILFDEKNDKYLFSPVFDLGRSLYDYIKYETIKKIIGGDKKILQEKIINDSFSVLKDENNKHINFVLYFKNSKDNNFRKAIERIKSRINMYKIYEIIDNTPLLNIDLKKFYKIVMAERYRILFT